jgi:L-ascorbate metabolism protein UlaG (beta-lactamase superfamily)
MALPLVSALEALLSPHARQQNDRSTFRELNVRSRGEALPAGLSLTWLGTASFRLGYQGFDLLIDPYVSRPTLARTLGKRALRVNADALRAHIPRAYAVLVGHTHFDHALDVPAISAMHGCKVYGSSSLQRLMQLHGLPERAVRVVPGQVLALGPFEVTFVESVHAKLIAGLGVLHGGEFSCDHLDELRGAAYHCGQVYGIHIAVAGVTFYHQGSANLIDGNIRHRGVDYFLAGIAGRGFTRDYTRRVLSRLEPRVVIAHHFDDFFRPLEARMGFSLNVNLGGFVEEVKRVSADFRVQTLELGQTWANA